MCDNRCDFSIATCSLWHAEDGGVDVAAFLHQCDLQGTPGRTLHRQDNCGSDR
jgi:hypothetical protein